MHLGILEQKDEVVSCRLNFVYVNLSDGWRKEHSSASHAFLDNLVDKNYDFCLNCNNYANLGTIETTKYDIMQLRETKSIFAKWRD